MNTIDKFLNKHPDWDLKDLSRSLNIRLDIISALQNERLDQDVAHTVIDYVDTRIKGIKKSPLPKFDHPIVIAPTVFKGGTGKSSSFINLSMALAEMGFSVLLIDTDGQVDSTCSYYREDGSGAGSVYDAIINMEDIRNYIYRTEYDRIDIVPSSYEMMEIEQQLQSVPCKDQILKICLEGVLQDNYYDFIMFDVNSMMSTFSTAVWLSSSPIYLYSIIEAAPFSLKALPPVFGKIEQIKRFNKEIRFLGVILNKVTERKTIYKKIVEVLEGGMIEEIQGNVFQTFIHNDANIEKSQERSIPVRELNKNCRAVEEFDALAKEIVERVCEYEQIKSFGYN